MKHTASEEEESFRCESRTSEIAPDAPDSPISRASSRASVFSSSSIDDVHLKKGKIRNNNKPRIPIKPRVPTRWSLNVRIIKPENNGNFGYLIAHRGHIQEFLSEKLKNAGVESVTWKEFGRIPAAAHEKQDYYFDARIESKEVMSSDKDSDLIIDGLIDMCREFRFMLHDQIFFEIPELQTTFFKEIHLNHAELPLDGLAVGNRVNPGLMLVRGDYFAEPKPTNLPSEISFEHDKQLVSIVFAVRFSTSTAEDSLNFGGFRMQFPYGNIKRIVVDFSDSNQNCVFLELRNVPLLWEAFPKNANTLNIQRCLDWARVLGWPADAHKLSVGCSEEAFSQSPCLKLQFNKSDELSKVPTEILFEVVTRLQSRSNATLHFGSVFSSRRKLAPSPALHSLGTHRANYALQALITRGSVFMDQLFDAADERHLPKPDEPMELIHEPQFLRLVRACMAAHTTVTEEALEQLLCIIDEQRRIDVVETFHACWKLRQTAVRTVIPRNCVLVPKAVITPSRVLLMAPETMMINRVLRRFGPENALRCVFRDENLKKLILRDFAIRDADHADNAATDAIRLTLRDGIRVAGRLYSFLGWSNSQLRDQGCYMYAPKIDRISGKTTGTIEDIRRWMGNFENVKTVSKLMSRMGQCFTQAQPTLRLRPKDYVVEPDVMGGIGGKYCFSDGCGRISFKLANRIASRLELEIVPSVLQIRFKGFKGILVVDPMIDEIVDSPKIVFRESQQKFHVDSDCLDYLEIVKYSMPSPMCLNRPLITVLDHVSANQSISSHTRITNRVHYYLEKELSLLSNMLITEERAAEELMNRVSIPIDWYAARKAEMELTTDPFVRSMLSAIYRCIVVNHVAKSKLFLPKDLGRSMYGVVDETGLLQHGQVFIQYSKNMEPNPLDPQPIIHLGKVMITKNPCLVPGDVRVFEAVFQPALTHLVDVVVFPQHGPRPHPDEMAGSDLDGDEYSVMFDAELFLDRNEAPMIYPNSSSEANSDDDVRMTTTDMMIDFFLKYMKQDAVGRLSTAHLACADVYGLFSDQCNSIALKCAVAVDFPKSGTPAEALSKEERTEVNPDYMSAAHKPVYFSRHLNGQIHRKGKRIEEMLEFHDSQTGEQPMEYDTVLCPDGYTPEDDELFRASSVLEEYASRVQQLLDEYGIESEAAVVSGHATTLKRMAAMEKDDYSFYHTEKVVGLRYDQIFKTFRARFLKEFGGEPANQDSDGKLIVRQEMHAKIRQWYFVAYVRSPMAKTGRVMGRSLPWVVWEVLVDARRKLYLETPTTTYRLHHPIAVKLNCEMQNSLAEHSEQLGQFLKRVNTDRNALFLKRYTSIYGPNLPRIVFLLNQWLEKESILPSDQLTIWHVGRLLIRFALGAGEVNPMIDYEKSNLAPTIVFKRWLTRNNTWNKEEHPLNWADAGTLMLEFLRYLASQSFALAERLLLRVFDDKHIVEPILWDKQQWMPLHNIAYRTFHLIAASGRFNSLRLDDELLAEHVTESKAPIVVKKWMNGKWYSDDVYIGREEIVKALKTWTGIKDIKIRESVQETSFAPALEYVTAVGSALARQRLAKVLMLSGETILDAIAHKTVPHELQEDMF